MYSLWQLFMYTFINDFGNILMFCKCYIFCTGYVAWISKVCNPYEYIPKAQPTQYVCISMTSVVEHQFLVFKVNYIFICLKGNRFKENFNVFWIRGVKSCQKLHPKYFPKYRHFISKLVSVGQKLELVSKELNHLAAILHVHAGGLNFMK